MKKTKKLLWKDLERNLNSTDKNDLLELIHDLYDAGKRNQAFLHARLGLGDDVLKPYKDTISRWTCPDVLEEQDYSTARARRAISDYKKATGRPVGIAELTVHYCEECTSFLGYCSLDDEFYFKALLRVFEQALKIISRLEPGLQRSFLDRLACVRRESGNWGSGIGDYMD
ncbi:MAG: hypothetical protein ABIJ42_00465, partial [Acidobacteriota bacterium]